jgi:SAM-dependent methyltransferase
MLWKNLDPDIWYNAVYKNPPEWLREIFVEQIEITKKVLQQYDKKSLCDIGCATGELLMHCFSLCDYVIGIDVNKKLLDKARELHPELDTKAYLIHGNALELQHLIASHLPHNFCKTSRVATLVMNTLGILPPPLYKTILDEIVKWIHEDGAGIIGCWNKEFFQQGLEWHRQHPELCGEITESDYDTENSLIKIKETGYISKWWSEEELRNLLLKYAHDFNLQFYKKGAGIFVVLSSKNRELKLT